MLDALKNKHFPQKQTMPPGVKFASYFVIHGIN